MICPGPFPSVDQLQLHLVSAPFFAKSNKEEGVTSTSVSQAELKSAVLCVADILVCRGMSEEIAGIADGITIVDLPHGAASPTQLRAAVDQQALVDRLQAPPTVLAQDNRSLVITAGQDVAKKSKKLRQMARAMECLRSAAREKLIAIVSVPAEDQRANPLTKCHTSPTTHWKELEFVQGSQPAVLLFQQEAAQYSQLKKSPRQLGEVVQTSIVAAEEQQLEDWSDVMDVDELVRNTEANTRPSAQSLVTDTSMGPATPQAYFTSPFLLPPIHFHHPRFIFRIKEVGRTAFRTLWSAPLELTDCWRCIAKVPQVRTATAFQLCNPCAIEHHSLKVDWVVMPHFYSGQRIRTLGLVACWNAEVPVLTGARRHENKKLFAPGQGLGTRRASRDFQGQPAQPQRARYGGRLATLELLQSLYTPDCAGPYVIQLNSAGTRFVDAATSRNLLSMANHGRMGAGAGRQANAQFAPPTSGNSIAVTSCATEAIYHGDQVLEHYSSHHNLNFVDRAGNRFDFETT